jgi:hypothetical protein
MRVGTEPPPLGERFKGCAAELDGIHWTAKGIAAAKTTRRPIRALVRFILASVPSFGRDPNGPSLWNGTPASHVRPRVSGMKATVITLGLKSVGYAAGVSAGVFTMFVRRLAVQWSFSPAP